MKKAVGCLAACIVAVVVLFAWANAPAAALVSPSHVTKVLVVKSQHRLYLLNGNQTIATFSVALGRGGRGPKRREGDGLTPEGLYTIDSHNSHSAFFRALHISYPNAQDRANARSLGASPGGSVMVHGLSPRAAWIGRIQRWADWTNGCVALSDPEMQRVYDAVRDGTPIEIRP